jgi:tRNA U34 5-methylaminomethyl-2-thiouridine-forming methyltransferase MnmC
VQDWAPANHGSWRFSPHESCELVVVFGDARETVPAWQGAADAWFLDGFSPAKNPELWGADLLQALAAKTRADGTFATYSAAGWVRRNLEAAGFEIEKRPGFGRKREMMAGRLR